MSNTYIALLEAMRSKPMTIDEEPYDSVMRSLFTLYTLHHPINNALMQKNFRTLGELLSDVPRRVQDQVLHLVCDLFSIDEYEAFQQGVRFGFRLADELRQMDEEDPNGCGVKPLEEMRRHGE